MTLVSELLLNTRLALPPTKIQIDTALPEHHLYNQPTYTSAQ